MVPGPLLTRPSRSGCPLLRLETQLHIGVCRFDKVDQSGGIDGASGPELYVAHVFTGTFQQARWVREFGATEESDTDMVSERVDIGERVTEPENRRM